VGFAPDGYRFAIILDFFCNTPGNSGVIQNGNVHRDASVSVGLPETGKQTSQPGWVMSMFKSIKKTLSALHSDEQGADMVEYILIVAAVGLPLVAVIIWFWHEISGKASEWWEQISGSQTPSGQTDPTNF